MLLDVSESPSARVELTRRVALRYVRALLLPQDPCNVNYADGTRFLGLNFWNAEVGVVTNLELPLSAKTPQVCWTCRQA